ncbi:helix-turn-helix transcriptional regulator [Macrococcoides caseolyticum]|uniref:helix-turn-helix transcriptional regulator n=1 Tax=Macrococcoides caseolyticum TaxID=69966 RepID=UPI000312ECC6|nr:helix-turn-helix transcriptional regulator [Macrococcus caseolyticus]
MHPTESKSYTLKMLRAKFNLTQKQAGEKVGVTENIWFNWENARSFPSVLHLKKIEEAFGVSYNDIIFLNKNNG